MNCADYDAFNAAGGRLLEIWHDEPGHHVEFVRKPTGFLLCCATLYVAFARTEYTSRPPD